MTKPKRNDAPATDDSDLWQTPPWFVERLVTHLGPIALDPCASRCISSTVHTVPAVVRYDEHKDGLYASNWLRECESYGNGSRLVYVNPPYSRGNLPLATALCADWAEKGCEVVTLIPARTGENWFDEHVWQRGTSACFLHGRVKFFDPRTGKEAKGTGRFSSVAVYYGPRPEVFCDAMDGAGATVRLNSVRAA
jgi:hypothetical protein